MTGFEIAVNVMVMVLVAIAFVKMINYGFGALFAFTGSTLEIQDVFGYVAMPLAWLLGVPWHECFHVGRLIATEILVNEFVSYGELAQVIGGKALCACHQNPVDCHCRSLRLCRYCGSIGIEHRRSGRDGTRASW